MGVRESDACVWYDAGSAISDGGTDGPIESCAGLCLPIEPLGWEPPSLLWIGAEADAPTCPNIAPALGYEGNANLGTSPLPCTTCSCSPPAGACALPAMMTASALVCPGTAPSALSSPFDPPSGWDGTCTANDAIPVGQLCDGLPCVRSLVVAPMELTEGVCMPTQSQPTPPAPTWATFALACIGEVTGACPTPGEVCAAATLTTMPGFLECIFHDGDVDCPNFAPYVDKHTFYGGVDDTRSCAPCTCGTPVEQGARPPRSPSTRTARA